MKKYAVYAFKKELKKEVRLTTQPSSEKDAEMLLKYYKTQTSQDWRAKYRDFKIKLWK
jgi:hypothetical protein